MKRDRSCTQAEHTLPTRKSPRHNVAPQPKQKGLRSRSKSPRQQDASVIEGGGLRSVAVGLLGLVGLVGHTKSSATSEPTYETLQKQQQAYFERRADALEVKFQTVKRGDEEDFFAKVGRYDRRIKYTKRRLDKFLHPPDVTRFRRELSRGDGDVVETFSVAHNDEANLHALKMYAREIDADKLSLEDLEALRATDLSQPDNFDRFDAAADRTAKDHADAVASRFVSRILEAEHKPLEDSFPEVPNDKLGRWMQGNFGNKFSIVKELFGDVSGEAYVVTYYRLIGYSSERVEFMRARLVDLKYLRTVIAKRIAKPISIARGAAFRLHVADTLSARWPTLDLKTASGEEIASFWNAARDLYDAEYFGGTLARLDNPITYLEMQDAMASATNSNLNFGSRCNIYVGSAAHFVNMRNIFENFSLTFLDSHKLKSLRQEFGEAHLATFSDIRLMHLMIFEHELTHTFQSKMQLDEKWDIGKSSHDDVFYRMLRSWSGQTQATDAVKYGTRLLMEGKPLDEAGADILGKVREQYWNTGSAMSSVPLIEHSVAQGMLNTLIALSERGEEMDPFGLGPASSLWSAHVLAEDAVDEEAVDEEAVADGGMGGLEPAGHDVGTVAEGTAPPRDPASQTHRVDTTLNGGRANGRTKRETSKTRKHRKQRSSSRIVCNMTKSKQFRTAP